MTPGCCSTIASRLPDDAVDERRLADAGSGPRPRTEGASGGHVAPRARRSGTPSVATTSTGSRQVGGRGAVEERPARKAHVGQQVAVALGFVLQHSGDILPDQQAGDADVAAEELIGHGQHALRRDRRDPGEKPFDETVPSKFAGSVTAWPLRDRPNAGGIDRCGAR